MSVGWDGGDGRAISKITYRTSYLPSSTYLLTARLVYASEERRYHYSTGLQCIGWSIKSQDTEVEEYLEYLSHLQDAFQETLVSLRGGVVSWAHKTNIRVIWSANNTCDSSFHPWTLLWVYGGPVPNTKCSGSDHGARALIVRISVPLLTPMVGHVRLVLLGYNCNCRTQKCGECIRAIGRPFFFEV